MIIRKIGPLSCAKVSGVLYALMGLILGAIFSLISLGTAAAGLDSEGGLGFLFGAAAIIILPIFYGILGFIGGAIGAWLYNLIAGWIGGIEVEFEQDTNQQPPTVADAQPQG